MALPALPKQFPNSMFSGDWHLTDRADEEYRWALFPWLVKKVRKHNVQHVWLLGDLTDRKDNHSSVLVNRIVENITWLAQYAQVNILMGNHDCIDPSTPFFRFLHNAQGVAYYMKPELITVGPSNVLLLPHSRDPETDWTDIDPTAADLILMHHTVQGSRVSNGMHIDGIDLDWFSGVPALSGDVHVPQRQGCVTYVGSPYHVHFGDAFRSRVLLWQDGRWGTLRHNNKQRIAVTVQSAEDIHSLACNPGDHIKVKLQLPKSELYQWEHHKQAVRTACKERGLEVHGLELVPPKRKTLALDDDDDPTPSKGTTPTKGPSNDDLFKEFCNRNELSDETIELGKQLMQQEE